MYRSTLLVVGLVIIAAAIVLATTRTPASEGAALRPIFINLTSGADNPQKASMALVLAASSLEAGREVTLYLNVSGVKLAGREYKLKMYRRDTLFGEFIAEQIDQGLKVIACPYCMEKNGLSEVDLLPGISVAGNDNFFVPLDDGAAVFSY